MLCQVRSAVRELDPGSRAKDDKAGRRRALSPAKICIIEDDDDIREALEDLLSSVGYRPQAYERADQALAELEEQAPDLILLDLMMPGMNGWQFRVAQRKRAKLRDIPVIVLSADVSPYAEAVDADAYIAKPIDFNELQTRLEQVLLAHERRRLVEKAVELERVRALGMLTASVAHEINNPLSYVLGCLELAETQAQTMEAAQQAAPEQLAQLRSNVAAASEGAGRVASIVELLSTFSRADDSAARSVDPVRAVQAAVRLARHQIEPRANLVTDLGEVPPVAGNEARLAQVVLNLLVNAVHAIPPSSPFAHEIRVSTRAEGASVVIEVSDDGVGIEPETLTKIFQPFFTTKAPGQGTGLGLSISRDIVMRMGGTIEARSRPGEGATFRIALPVPARSVTAPDTEQPASESGAYLKGQVKDTGDSQTGPDALSRVLTFWNAFGGGSERSGPRAYH